jgi:hypothetical protein
MKTKEKRLPTRYKKGTFFEPFFDPFGRRLHPKAFSYASQDSYAPTSRQDLTQCNLRNEFRHPNFPVTSGLKWLATWRNS